DLMGKDADNFMRWPSGSLRKLESEFHLNLTAEVLILARCSVWICDCRLETFQASLIPWPPTASMVDFIASAILRKEFSVSRNSTNQSFSTLTDKPSLSR